MKSLCRSHRAGHEGNGPPIGLVKKILKLRRVSEFHSHLFEFVAITVLLLRVSFHCRLDPLECETMRLEKSLLQPHRLTFLTHQPLYRSLYFKFPSSSAPRLKSLSVMNHF